MPGQDSIQVVRVLAVLRDQDVARRVGHALREARGAMAVREGLYELALRTDVDQALQLLEGRQFDVVLLETGEAGPQRGDVLEALCAAATDAAIVVVAAEGDQGAALAAIRRGAQECLARQQLDGPLVRQTIRLALERKQADRQRRRRADELDRLNRHLDDFACIASHDLKEPLEGIRTYCELVLQECGPRIDQDNRRRLTALGTICDRLTARVDSLLAYSRAGRLLAPQKQVDLNVVAADVMQTLRAVIRKRRALVRVAGRLPVVHGDNGLIGTVLANLVANAVKFNESLRPQVEIGALPGRPPTVYVRDNGIGIAAQQHEAVFEIFRRLHGRNKYEGAGAGLAIVRKIVEAHGGRVWLRSQPGLGSTFYFSLAPGGIPDAAQPPHWIARGADPAAGTTDQHGVAEARGGPARRQIAAPSPASPLEIRSAPC